MQPGSARKFGGTRRPGEILLVRSASHDRDRPTHQKVSTRRIAVPSLQSTMIPITPTLSIAENELHFEFVRSSGPGGQNVNKTSTAVELRFDVRRSPSLPESVRGRLLRRSDRRLTQDGILILDARRFRTQNQNRADAVERLVEILRRAAHKPKARRKTKPTRASKERRIGAKHNRAKKKIGRRAVSDSADA